MVKEYTDILILSASYGGGHNQVARALTQELQRQAPGIKITTVDYCELLFPLINRISQFSYTQSIRHFPVGYALYYQATGNISPDSFWQRRLNRLGYSELIMLVNRLEPRVVISTFPLPAGVLSRMKEAGVLSAPVVTVITDMCVHSQWIHPKTDLYLVGSPEVAAGLEKRGVARDKIGITGIPILPVFREKVDSEMVRREFDFDSKAKIILFMGGNDGIFGTNHFNFILRDLPPDVQSVVITGSNQDLYDRLHSNSYQKYRVRAFKYVENVAGLMKISDLLVTKAGGVTISEALAVNLPMIIFKPTPGHEVANANYLLKHRAAFIAKRERSLKKVIYRMIVDDGFRQCFSRNCFKIATPDSAENGARLIMKLFTPSVRLFREYQDPLVRREIRV
ncbi:MAG: MGDG synthase family glycosyltransferase [Bacteroidota bacterium]